MRATLQGYILVNLGRIQSAILNDDDLFIDPALSLMGGWGTVALALLDGDPVAAAVIRQVVAGRREYSMNREERGM
jgi:hypothetical protein